MPRLLSSPRLSLRRLAMLAALATLTGVVLAAGCGNSGDTQGTGGHFGMTTGSSSSGKGGEGGTLFGNTSSSVNTSGTGTDTTTGGPAPGMPCKGTTSPGANLWAHNYGDASSQYGLAVATDASGNIFVAGSYSGNLAFGAKTADIAGANKAVFVAKLAPDGTAQWVRGFASKQVSGNALPLGIARAVTTDSIELAPYMITANAILAGLTDTPAAQKIPGFPEMLDHAKDHNPFNRNTLPEDVAQAIAMLADEGFYWINGQTIGVDGGENILNFH